VTQSCPINRRKVKISGNSDNRVSLIAASAGKVWLPAYRVRWTRDLTTWVPPANLSWSP
jgi:hypothetical protein